MCIYVVILSHTTQVHIWDLARLSWIVKSVEWSRLLIAQGDLSELHDDDLCLDEGKQVVVGVCAMARKSQSKPMKEILTRLQEFEYIKMIVFPEEVILQVCEPAPDHTSLRELVTLFVSVIELQALQA